MNKTPETASFHVTEPCNMGCKFCYATFKDFKVGKMIDIFDAMVCIKKLYEAGVQKITFAGGEPLLHPKLRQMIDYAKSLGMTTGIITNGSLLTEKWLISTMKTLDWVGLSIDSINPETNMKIGRSSKLHVDYLSLISMIKVLGFKLKLNTVVNSYNWKEDMSRFMRITEPERWKVFQALRIKGQNDRNWEEIKVSDQQFQHYLETHKYVKNLVPENNEAMTGSYLLIDPIGRLFENSVGEHTYSTESLIDTSFEECFSDINIDYKMFLKRGGLYKW